MKKTLRTSFLLSAFAFTLSACATVTDHPANQTSQAMEQNQGAAMVDEMTQPPAAPAMPAMTPGQGPKTFTHMAHHPADQTPPAMTSGTGSPATTRNNFV